MKLLTFCSGKYLSSMIEEIKVEGEKVFCVNVIIHYPQDTINYSLGESCLFLL